MLKYSRYNHMVKIPDEDAYALLNFRTGAFARLSPLQKDLFEVAADLDENSSKVKKFRRGGFLVSYDELRHMRTQAYMASGWGRVLGLTICPTMACNFACPYCFEEQRSGRMSKETEENVVKFAERFLERLPCQDMGVSWFGGEPLLCPDIIESLSEKLMALADMKNCDYHARIVTNGWFLTSEIVTMLERVKVVDMQITLDGPTPETNDHLRREKNGGSSFARIIKNLENLHTKKIKVMLRCNLNHENALLFPRLKEKITAIAKQNGFAVRVYPAYMDGELKESSQAAGIALSMEAFSNLVGGWDDVQDPMQKESYAVPTFCMAQNINGFAIDEQGYLYKCWEAIGYGAKSFGNVRDFDILRESEGDMGAWDAYFETLFPESDRECMDCKVFPVCKGGCPHKRLLGKRTCLPLKYDLDGYVLNRYRIWKKGQDKQGRREDEAP